MINSIYRKSILLSLLCLFLVACGVPQDNQPARPEEETRTTSPTTTTEQQQQLSLIHI